VDAAALALARLAAVAIWLGAAVVVLHLYAISVGVALSGAGFLGLVVAFSAQHSVNDYITGLHVLFEDRYGVGDEIELTTPTGQHVRGTVVALGAFATAIETDDAIHHLANRLMGDLANHSQVGVVSTLEIAQPSERVVRIAADAAAAAQRRRPSMPDVVIEEVDPMGERAETARSRVTIRSAESLGDTDRLELGREMDRLSDAALADVGRRRFGRRRRHRSRSGNDRT
jgi:hypothetical protein